MLDKKDLDAIDQLITSQLNAVLKHKFEEVVEVMFANDNTDNTDDIPTSSHRKYEKGLDRLRKTTYITAELEDALKYRTYHDRSKNESGHIRAALEAYLVDDIKCIKANKSK